MAASDVKKIVEYRWAVVWERALGLPPINSGSPDQIRWATSLRPYILYRSIDPDDPELYPSALALAATALDARSWIDWKYHPNDFITGVCNIAGIKPPEPPFKHDKADTTSKKEA